MNGRTRLRAVGDPAALAEQLHAEVQRRVTESRGRLREFFLNYAELDRLAGNDQLAAEMEVLAGRLQVVDAGPGPLSTGRRR